MSPFSPESIRSELNQQGYRLTPQRKKILNIFQVLPQGEHLSAEELHRTLREQEERISLSTVYRTLHLMSYMGLLRELELAEGHKHYELNRSQPDQHHHIVCVYCGRTAEFKHDLANQIGSKQAEREGYHLLDCQLTIYGVCPDCTPLNDSKS